MSAAREALGAIGRALEAFEEVVVLGVRADPKPYPVVPLAERQSPVTTADSRREYWPRRVNLFQLQALVVRISSEGSERVVSFCLDFLRETQ